MPKLEILISRRKLLITAAIVLLSCSSRLQVFSQEGEKAAEGGDPAGLTNAVGMKLVLVKEGEFLMGSKNEFGRWAHEHQHKVRISEPYYIGACEVTQGEYQ